MAYKLFFSSLAAFLFFSEMQAQEVIKADSMRPEHSSHMPAQPLQQEHTSVLEPIISRPEYAGTVSLPKVNPNATAIKPAYSANPWLMQWKGGGVYGASSFRESPAMGFGRTASFLMTQRIGNGLLTGNFSVNKDYMSGWGYMNSADMGMQLTYPVSRNVGFSAFGGFRQAGLLSRGMPNKFGFHYGGYITLITDNGKFGIDIGMRRYYDPFSRQWVNVPIAAPFVTVWGQRMSFDMGGLLLQSIRGLDEWLNPKRNFSGGSPRGGGIIVPDINPHFYFPPPEIPYIK